MGNYCGNRLKVCGDSADLRRFMEVGLIANDFELEYFYLIPDDLVLDKDIVKWCKENWGCSNYCNVTIEICVPTELVITFDSALTPMVGLVERMQMDFPSLMFKLTYVEVGAGISGVLYTSNVRDDYGKPFLVHKDDCDIFYSFGDDVYETYIDGSIEICSYDIVKLWFER